MSASESGHPRCVAHRGGAGLWPENTLAAFSNALEAGAEAIELDVHLSRDGHVVVHHDATLKAGIARTPDGTWLTETGPHLGDLTLDEIKAYDVGRLDPGAPHTALYPDQTAIDGQTIPTLAEVMSTVRRMAPKTDVFVEIKSSLLDVMPESDLYRFVERVVRCLQDTKTMNRAIFLAFDWRALEMVETMAPDIRRSYSTIPRGWLTGAAPETIRKALRPEMFDALQDHLKENRIWLGGLGTDGSIPGIIADRGGHYWTPYFEDVTLSAMVEAHDQNLPVYPWTVNEAQDLQRMIDHGVAGIITDRPDRLMALR